MAQQKKIPDNAYRTISLERAEVNEDERKISISFSSEEPVARWYGNEILVHDKESVNLKRLNEVGTLLFAHGRDPNYGVVPIGGIEKAWLSDDERVLRADIHFDADDEKAERIWKKVKSGDLTGVSFGYSIDLDSIEEVEAGKKSEDGRFKGPAVLVKKWEPHEISIEPTPADSTIGVGRSEELSEGGESTLAEEIKKVEDVVEQEVKEAPVEEVEVKAEPVVEEKDIAELTRQEILDIRKLAREVGCFDEKDVDAFISEGRNLEYVRKVALERMIENKAPIGTAGLEVKADEHDKYRAAAIDAFAMRGGIPVDKPAPGANDLRGFSLLDLARDCVERKEGSWRGLSKLQIAERAVFGSDDFPYITANLANKSMMKAYEAVPTTFQIWTSKVSVPDFKSMYVNQLSDAPDLDIVYPNGEYQNAEFSETRESYAVMTYGKIFSLSRQAIINDDMSALTKIPAKFGNAARRKMNALVYSILTTNGNMADGTALFAAGHGNLEGTAANKAAPSVTTLGSARAYMRKQTALGGNQGINITPKFLIVPPDLETTSEQLISSIVDPTKYNNTPNIRIAGGLDLIVDAVLTNPTAWYLAADPSQVDTIECAYLDGNEAPLLESRAGWKVDGMEYKVRIDFGCKAIDHRGLFKNAGTA